MEGVFEVEQIVRIEQTIDTLETLDDASQLVALLHRDTQRVEIANGV
jgi:hypothetical protein